MLGVNDLVVVDTVDSLLIANKNNIQDIKRLVNLLEKKHKHLLDIKVEYPECPALKQGVMLPSYPGLEREKQEYITNCVKEYIITHLNKGISQHAENV